MRWIKKRDEPPASLTAFLEVQLPVGVNLDYDQGFTRKAELRREFIAEQFGLCAYTGTPIDDRLCKELPLEIDPSNAARPVRYQAHIEHLKPQSVCRQELIDQGLEPGRNLGEDMDHRNMVAALLVNGAEVEQFGAAIRKNEPIPIWPTQCDCEIRLRFHRNGNVEGCDEDAKKTVRILKLQHETLQTWRRAALDIFLAPDVIRTREELDELIKRLDQPHNGQLVEYCFCIKNVASEMLASNT